MSTVMEKVEESIKRMPEGLLDELSQKQLSKVMRRQTWPDHERAEHSVFEVALVQGTVPREAYAELLFQVLPIYEALEDRAEDLKDDPVAGPVIFPELNRKEAIQADLEFYAGPDSSEKFELLPVTEEYRDRIRSATPAQYVAHHYTRYLADLSGGFPIDQALTTAWNLETDGRRYYTWPGIPDAMAFKKTYREALSELPVSVEEKRSIIQEVLYAYELNIEMVEILADRYEMRSNGDSPVAHP